MKKYTDNIQQMNSSEIIQMRIKVSRSMLNDGKKAILNEAMDKRVIQLEAKKNNLVVSCNEQ